MLVELLKEVGEGLETTFRRGQHVRHLSTDLLHQVAATHVTGDEEQHSLTVELCEGMQAKVYL